MAARSRDRPPMLATGRYPQWQSSFLRCIDTRPNGDALRKCILEGPYQPTTVTIPVAPPTENSPAVPKRTTVETILTMSLENEDHFESEKVAIHLLLTGIRDEIYSTVDACKIAHEMWEAIERLQQGESLNIQDVKTNLEVNEIHAERISENANPLALVAVAQQYPDPYYQAPKSHKSYATQPKASLQTRSHATTKHNGKEMAKLITPSSESTSKEDSDTEQAQRDQGMQKNLELIAKKPKRAKDYTYHKKKMLLCKQAEKGVPLQAEQAAWLEDMDEEIDEQELDAHYSFMAKIQETKFERYKALNDRTVDYDKLERKLNKTLRVLAQKDVDIKEGLKVKAYEILVVKEKHDEDLHGNDLLIDNRASDLYTISLQETTSSTPICLMAKASPTQAWLWHRRHCHFNFDYINLLLKKDVMVGLPKLKYVKDQLCSSCEVSKAKRSSFKTKDVPSLKGRLNLLHMDLCGPMRVASINGKKYVLVIIDDYTRYTWTLFLRSKDETPEVLKDFLIMIQQNLQTLVTSVRTDRGIEFLNKTHHAFFKKEGIEHQTSIPRTPEQNIIVERQNLSTFLFLEFEEVLRLLLIDALDLVEDDCFDVGAYGDIVKIVSTSVRSGTAEEFSVAGTAGIVIVVGWYGPSKMHFLKASPFGLVSMYLKKRDFH
nr:retrovirus-related Pol polyprotein from transposon TNT 1-94 [Tanacetum cinerariifolium]